MNRKPQSSCFDRHRSGGCTANTVRLCLLLLLFFAFVRSAEAQHTIKLPRIGFISPLSASAASLNVDAFRSGLREFGYFDGKNIAIEYRFATGDASQLSEIVAALVSLNVDVLVVGSTPGALTAKNTTNVVPIVMLASEPVESGLVASIARPGGNITGLNRLASELAAKRLELLKETFPKVTQVAFLFDSTHASDKRALRGVHETARVIGVQVQEIPVRSLNDFDSAFAAISREGADALLSSERPLFNTHRTRIVDFAARRRLPAVYGLREFVESGGLMSYASSLPDLYRRAAYFVDRILKGAKPADLPVEQPTKFELIISLKTAKQIGVTIPPNVLARADKVIK